MQRRVRGSTVLVGAACLLSSSAHADSKGDADLLIRRRWVAVDASYHERPNRGDYQSIAAVLLRGEFPYGSASFEPEMPFVFDRSLNASATSFFGNPTFAVKGHWRAQRLALHAGGAVSLPVATIEDENGGRSAAYLLATGTQGLWNLWWYYPDAAAAVAPFGVRYVSAEGLDLGAEATVGLIFPVRVNVNPQPLGTLQAGVHAGYASRDFETGLRLREVRIPGNGPGDLYQTSLEPYVTVMLAPAFLGAAFLMNLDKPLGPFFSRNGLNRDGVWALRFEAGVRF